MNQASMSKVTTVNVSKFYFEGQNILHYSCVIVYIVPFVSNNLEWCCFVYEDHKILNVTT